MSRKGLVSTTVVVMAGGEGSRTKAFTSVPKPLLPLPDRPAIEVIMSSFAAQGARRFVIVVRAHAHADAVRAALGQGDLPYEVIFVDEEHPRGTCGGLASVPTRLLSDPLFLTNCDTLLSADFTQILDEHRDAAAACTVIGVRGTIGGGPALIELGTEVRSVTIRPSQRTSAVFNTGVYLLSRRAVQLIPIDTPFNTPDLINRLSREGALVHVHLLPDGSRLDIGDWSGYHLALAALAHDSGPFRRNRR